jgi:hypothetical protein
MTNDTIAFRNSALESVSSPEDTLSVEVLSRPLRAPLVREIAPAASRRRCPSCQSIVYSRRHRLCGVCSLPLPEEFLFSIAEARRIEKLLESERQRHRKWLAENFQPLS